MVQDKVQLMCQGLERRQLDGGAFRITDAFAALTADVVSEYAFGVSFGQLDDPEWPNLHDTVVKLGAFGSSPLTKFLRIACPGNILIDSLP